MPRAPRIHDLGLCYHVTQRGNAQKRIFFDNFDRVNFCELMAEGVERFGHQIHGFCLMDNHFHLLIQAGIQPIGKALQNMTFRHAKRLNKKYETTGHQFQGRYYAGIIEDNESFKQVLKYIHQNPVRANMVKIPKEYIWSSHKHYISKVEISWIEKDFSLSLFSTNPEKARKQYQAFMNEPQDEEIIEKIRASSAEYVISNDDFIKKIKKSHREIVKIPYLDLSELSYLVCNFFGTNPGAVSGQFSNHHANYLRGIIGYILLNHSTQSLSSFAEYTGKSLSSISRATQKITNKLVFDNDLETKYSIKAILKLIESVYL